MSTFKDSTFNASNPVFYNTTNNIGALPAFYPPRESLLRTLAEVAVKRASWNPDAPKCHPNTRKPIRTSLTKWPDDPGGHPVQWICGYTGTGKTTIAQTMAEYWAKEGRLAATFFFSRLSEDTSSTEYFKETIAYQLLQILSFPDDALRFLQREELSARGWAAIVDALSSLPQTRPPPRLPMIIIFDGLDECHDLDEPISLLRDILASASKLKHLIKFLVCCRPELMIEKTFTDLNPGGTVTRRVTIGEDRADHNDIRTSLRHSFKRICEVRRKENTISIRNGLWPSEYEVEELVDRASGQFVFAAIVIAFVDDEYEDPVELLNRVLERRGPSFRAIDDLYLVILERVDARIGSPELRRMLRNLLWSVSRMSTHMLPHFWFEEQVKFNILVKHLHTVLHRPDGLDGAIRLRHKSFDDFLERPSSRHSFSISWVSRWFACVRSNSVHTSSFYGAELDQHHRQTCEGFIVVFQEPFRRLRYMYLKKGQEVHCCT
ncbi:hypothetical protein BDN72DRAFT_333726 [Pluteus cervinus]|uniref:Uncharacterized protein n=1 Tax=Pluteus cervinus TaxID=181527 RepID=A0ACD3AC15_9AGAR|nr:hypothetical protein BDN72DRAFT_333726 [Pluteus cervinus]